ncbi:MAG: FKBP-type peptidyl-prolyl cis-trans isomerase [Ilumatobacter sp.]
MSQPSDSFIEMRRTLALITITALSLAACGGSDDADTVANEADTVEESEDADVTDTLPAVEAPPSNPDKPEVELPSELPTELVRTVLTEGTGDAAEAGDTVIVDYVGVRSVDGVEFDASYDREPFPVSLGTGSVIQGWDDGLVSAQAGEQVQLDIPSDLAYGDAARSEVIRENEALTFVIDVRAVIKSADPADAPTTPGVTLSVGEGVADTEFEDLVVGDGATLEIGNTAVIRYVNFRGDNGVAIETNWNSDPVQVPYSENLLSGLLEGMEGMNVGGRRAITVPPEDGFGEEGNPQGGLPAGTDMIFVIELVGTY